MSTTPKPTSKQKKSRRRGRAEPRDTTQKVTAFHVDTPAPRPGFGFLDEAGLARMRAKAIDLLADYGVVVVHRDAHAALMLAGGEPNGGDRLKLPRELIEEALAQTPKLATLCGKTPARDAALPRGDSGFVMRTGTGAHGFVDPDTSVYRNMDLSDVPTIAAVANQLDEVAFIAHPFVYGVHELTSDIHGFASMISRTDKHCWIQPYNKENVEYLLRLAAVAAGGEDALRARPIASCIACSFSPLEFKVMDVEAIIQCGRYGLPIHACALPSAGGTAPISVAGLVLMGAAEIVAMVTMAHVLAPGTPVIATPLMFTLDMRTGSALQSCVESQQAAGMAVQLMKQGFGLITHTYGVGSDTPDVDAQSMTERAMLGQTIALAGADILGGVGQLECATVFSPVQAVLDNEVGAMLRRYIRAPELDDEALNWIEMSKIRVGGHFLDSSHTLAHCRRQFIPEAFLREDRDGYEASGRRTAVDQAREMCMEFIGRPPPDGLPGEDALAEMTRIVADADRHIIGKAQAHTGAVEEI